ncbi:metal-sulfur cluster assembly factor [Albibacterium sp.]|uniref:metal-sulfur cluster assembly factor n=1 Tax=Albibacterium sp. TaxID=2952885 RepID=UPI002B5D096D|nr:iron-sulfur cluster assembly protein [Albibacterium sp.]HUH19932.1 iron-sulfur cluster assembly protein [Albibacterium sp.]
MELQINDPFFQEKNKAMDGLYSVLDPELMVNIMDLGLVYDIDFASEGKIIITMTLTTPGCPMGDAISLGVKNVLNEDFPDREVDIDIVWDPQWTVEKVSAAGREQLGF